MDTMYLYINTTIDPQNAYKYLLDKSENIYVSDVCEKINFIKKCVPLGGLSSEIRYTVDGKVNNVTLSNFQTETVSITKEQYADLNLTLVSGNINARISFYGGAGNLDTSLKTISVNKTIEQADTAGLYNISINVTLPPDAKPGYYTLTDRVSSNMTYLEPGESMNTGDIWVYSPERQIVNAGFYYKGNTGATNVMTFNITYRAMKIMNVNTIPGPVYVSRNFRTGEIWGGSN